MIRNYAKRTKDLFTRKAAEVVVFVMLQYLKM